MTHENLTYSLTKRISIYEIRTVRPHLYVRFNRMPQVLEESQQNDVKLRESLRKILPPDLSPTLVTDAERLVNESGLALRENLFALFTGEIDAALKLDLEPSTINCK